MLPRRKLPEIYKSPELAGRSVSDIIDPDCTLPVDFTMMQEGPYRWLDDGGETIKLTLFKEENPYEYFAHCNLNVHDGNYVCFDGVEVDTHERGKGYGLQMYLAAIDYAHSLGLPFQTQDYDQTENAVKIWSTLTAAGVATVIHPFEPCYTRSVFDRRTGKNRTEQRYKGLYRVDPLGTS